MAKSARGRGKGSKGTRHKSHRQKSVRCAEGRKARKITRQNCDRKPGRLARTRLMTKAAAA